MVTLVKVSPARDPKALLPPAPPSAPDSPPPLPDWISTSSIRKMQDSSRTTVSTSTTQAGTRSDTSCAHSNVVIVAPLLTDSINRHYRRPAGRGKGIFRPH